MAPHWLWIALRVESAAARSNYKRRYQRTEATNAVDDSASGKVDHTTVEDLVFLACERSQPSLPGPHPVPAEKEPEKDM